MSILFSYVNLLYIYLSCEINVEEFKKKSSLWPHPKIEKISPTLYIPKGKTKTLPKLYYEKSN